MSQAVVANQSAVISVSQPGPESPAQKSTISIQNAANSSTQFSGTAGAANTSNFASSHLNSRSRRTKPDPNKLLGTDEIASKVFHKETQSIVNSLPDIASTVMNEEISWDEPQSNQELIESVFSEVGLHEIPKVILDPHSAVRIIVDWEMLKGCVSVDVRVVDKAVLFVQEEAAVKLFEHLFWIVNIIKFQPDNARLVKKLRRNISTSYTAVLSKCPSPKEDILAVVQFCYGYLIHAMHHKLFVKQRSLFNTRFVLDCYHIVCYEITGLLVSDTYVYGQIEKLFGNRFFLYKQEGILSLTNIDLYEGSTFLQKTQVDKADLEKLRAEAEKINEEDKKEFAKFGLDLTGKFAQCSKILHANSKTNLLLAKFEGEFAKKMNELTSREDFAEVLIRRAQKINESQLRQEEEDFHRETGGNNSSMLPNLKAQGIEVINLDDTVDKSKLSNSGAKKLTKGAGGQSLPVLKIKQKFDCSQVSPPLQMAAKNVTASTKKKTISFTSFNIPDFNIEKLKDLYDKQMGIVKKSTKGTPSSLTQTPKNPTKKPAKTTASHSTTQADTRTNPAQCSTATPQPTPQKDPQTPAPAPKPATTTRPTSTSSSKNTPKAAKP